MTETVDCFTKDFLASDVGKPYATLIMFVRSAGFEVAYTGSVRLSNGRCVFINPRANGVCVIQHPSVHGNRGTMQTFSAKNGASARLRLLGALFLLDNRPY